MAEQRTAWTRRVLVVAATLAIALPAVVAADPAGAWTPPVAPTWSPPDGTVPDGPSGAYLERGAAGSWPGATTTFDAARTDFHVQRQDTRVVVVLEGDHRFSLYFSVDQRPATVEGFHTYVDGDDPSAPRITSSMDASGCSDDEGWVDVTRADEVDGLLVHLELTFEHRCNVNPAPEVTHGAIRWDASTTDPAPNPVPIPDGLWAPPAAATPATGNHLYVEADPGTPLGDGGPLLVTGDAVWSALEALPPDGHTGRTLRFGGAGTGPGRDVRVELVAGRHRPEIEPGLYADLRDARTNPVAGGMTIDRGGWTCSVEDGWASVDEVAYSAGRLTRLLVRFAQGCPWNGRWIRGQIDWRAVPIIQQVTPNHGLRRAGQLVHVEGRDLADVREVTVGGIAATFEQHTPSGLSLRTPALATGSHDIRIEAEDGVVVGTGALGYTARSDTPTGPVDVQVTPGPASALVTWDPPAELGDGTITGVRVSVHNWQDWQMDRPLATVEVGPADTVALVTGLHPGWSDFTSVTYLTDLGPGDTARSTGNFIVPEVDVTPFDGVPTLVTQQYVDFAGRAPTTKERDAVVTAIRTGKVLPEAYVASMRTRPEWGGVRAPATRLYQAYFGRLPDAGGLAYWAGKLRSGTPLARASATFAASPEFRRTYGVLSNAAFVDLVYGNVLGRPADPSGRAYWVSRLARGTSRGVVMTNFSESSEHVRTTAPTVDAVLLYTGMLRRMPTPAEAAGGTARRAAPHAVDPVALAGSLRRSSAYATRFAG